MRAARGAETWLDLLYGLSCQQCQCHGLLPRDPILPFDTTLQAWQPQLHPGQSAAPAVAATQFTPIAAQMTGLQNNNQ